MSQNKLIVSNWKMNLNIENSIKIITNIGMPLDGRVLVIDALKMNSPFNAMSKP